MLAVLGFGLASVVMRASTASDSALVLLDPGHFEHHVTRFNAMENENRVNAVSNDQAWGWLRERIPFFECPDAEVE